MYDPIMYICVGLTNENIKQRPPIAYDNRKFNRVKNRRSEISDSTFKKRKLTQDRYREGIKRLMNMRLRSMGDSDRETVDPR